MTLCCYSSCLYHVHFPWFSYFPFLPSLIPVSSACVHRSAKCFSICPIQFHIIYIGHMTHFPREVVVVVSVCLFIYSLRKGCQAQAEKEWRKGIPLEQPPPKLDGYGYCTSFSTFEHCVCLPFGDGPADHVLDPLVCSNCP